MNSDVLVINHKNTILTFNFKKGRIFTYKKTIATLLAIFLMAVGVVSPHIIDSFDNLLEKFNFIVPADLNITIKTYKSGAFQKDLSFKTVSLSKRQAAKLGVNNIVEEDFIVKAQTTGQEQTLYEGYPWNIPFVKGSEADINTLGSETVRVGILDSGVSLNDEFEDIVRIDLVPDTIYDSLGIYNDVTGHGTGVAGVIAAEKNNKGIIGIAPNVSVYSIRVLDENNEAPISRIIAGIEWAIENDIDVLNMSFGTQNYSAQLYNAVRRAYENGIVLVASAGNINDESEQVTYPARFSEVISVGSCNQNGQESDFSPKSTNVDILAPGEYIDSVSLVDGYCVEYGTSFAAPHVTAAAALVLSADNTKNPEFVKQLLVATANVSENTRGILDIKNALDTLPDFGDVETIAPADIPENTKEIENFEISEDVVVGSWNKTLHEDLIYKGGYSSDAFDSSTIYEDDNADYFTNISHLCQTSKENILIFARAAYLADELYGYGNESNDGKKMYRFAPLHALGHTSSATSDDLSYVVEDNVEKSGVNSNYVADARYLFRLAKHFMNGSSVEYAASHMSNEYVPIKGANFRILREIVASEDAIYGKVERDANGEIEVIYEVKGIIYMDVLFGTYPNTKERAGWAILGLAAHLVADAFAHRVMIPTTAKTEQGGIFYSNNAPYCFFGTNHSEWNDSDNDGIRDSQEILDYITRTPNLTRLGYAMKEQVSYRVYYINQYNLCTCYHCLRELAGQGKLEVRDISKYIVNRKVSGQERYNCDDPDDCYEDRFEKGTKNALQRLITDFNTSTYCSIYTFMPEDESYTLKLNGLKKYIIDAGINFDSLTPTDKALVNKYSTGDDVL